MTTGIDQHDQGGDDYDHEGIAQNDDHDYKLKENLQDVQRSGRQPTQFDHTPGFNIQFTQSLALVVCLLVKIYISTCSLCVYKVREEEFTGYHCKASNSLGQHSAKITISGKAIFSRSF